MKDHHSYPTTYLGASDVAALTLVGCDENGLKSSFLHFGEDGSYSAYLVDEECEIPAHYEKVAAFSYWLKIFDDDRLVYSVYADDIEIFRAGAFGCIIKLYGKKEYGK